MPEGGAGSIVFATLIILLVFLPLFGLTGIEGRLLQPLALAYGVALTLRPVPGLVILCGLISPTALNLLVTPAIYLRVAGGDASRQ